MMILFFAVIAPVSGQNTKNSNLSLNVQNQSLSEVFQQISTLTDYKFFYDQSIVDKAPNITLNIRNATIQDVLDKITAQTNLYFQRTNNTISVSSTPPVSNVQSRQRQSKTVSGVITDTSGEPIIGANIVEKGTTNGTVTDIDGNFSLRVENNAVLYISYIGYLTYDINTVGKTTFNIVLQEDTKALDELIVIGYGTRQRRSITGAVDQIASDVFENRPVGNAMQALQGASANLIIQQSNMNPNDNQLSINIRGVSTITNNDPLVLIDGIITDLSSLNRINPDDIASISVLKDAGSAAIYGSRSSSGVLLVTTKQGSKNRKPIVRFNSMVGYETPHFLFSPVKGYENAILRNQAEVNVGRTPVYTPDEIRDLYEHEDQEYFLFQILKPALKQTYTASVSGGSETSTYMASAGYYDQASNFVGGDYGMKRYNFRTNLTSEYGRLKFSSQLAYNRIMHHAPNAGNAIQNATRFPSYYYNKMKDSKGRYVDQFTSLGLLEAGGYRDRDEDNIIGNLTGELEIIKGLKAKGMFGLDLTANHRFVRTLEVAYYASETSEEPTSYTGQERNTEDYNEKYYRLNTQFLLDYDRIFNNVHHITGLVGFSNESYTQQANEIRKKFTDPDLGIPATDGLTEIDPINSYNTPDATIRTSIYSLFGRAGYSFADKYYGEVSFRYDGSSKFAKEHRWGFFPSVTAGWRVSQENFMETYRNTVGDLKIRGSYGVLGNQNVGDYRYMTTYTVYTNNYGFNKTPVSGTGFSFGNKDLEWETSATFNIGTDAAFLKNQLMVSFDYFNQTTSGILLSPEVPAVFGGAVAIENAGKMQNRGWEASINYNFNTIGMQHRINFNIADSKNKIIDFGDERINAKEQMSSLIREGIALNSYFGYKTDGFFKDEDDIANSALPVGASVAPGDVKYVDYYEDGVIDEKDRQVLGNAFPRYTFGLNYNLSWKGFDLGLFVQGVGKRSMVLRGELIRPYASNFTQVMFQHQLDYWGPTNMDARWPRLTADGSASNINNYGRDSDIYLLDAAYLRLKNIQIGYTLPKHITSKLGAGKLRMYLNAQNLLTLSATSFIDPESSEFGNNMGGIAGVASNSGRNYPTLIYYGCGLNLEF
ncbi:TonB-dependent receptor [uncultured Proteiniphilum sp.]|uniref:TonB-dependent receptor n=1 Tax=uncultured Proteiniphilum sp. TaxID=497637 RepID=UPI002619298A|nr:TonB-dependent receptor [uncultured Proteiniphilum sp.]